MPLAFESQRVTTISKLAEAGYGVATATTDPTVFRSIPVLDKNQMKWTPKVSDNTEDAQGNDWPTEDYLETWDGERDMELPVTAEDIGYELLASFGAVASSQPAISTDPTVWQHVFTMQDGNVSRQLMSRTLVEALAATVGGVNAYNAMFPGAVVQTFGMKSNGTSRISVSEKLRASGRRSAPGTTSGLTIAQMKAQLPAVGSRHYFLTTQASIKTTDNNAATNPMSYGCGVRLDSWGFDVDNALLADEGYFPGCMNDFNTVLGAPVNQVITLVVAISVVTAGTTNVTVTANGMPFSPKSVPVTTVGGETAAAVATLIRTALTNDTNVGPFFVVAGAGVNVTLTTKTPAANDATMQAVITAGNGITAANSTITTPGVAGGTDPTSGLVRHELLFGRRKVTISDFTVRANDQTKEIADMLTRRPIDWRLSMTGPVIAGGSGAYAFGLVIDIPLVKYDVVDIQNQTNGITQLKINPKSLFDTVQGFPIKATLTNTWPSYTS